MPVAAQSHDKEYFLKHLQYVASKGIKNPMATWLTAQSWNETNEGASHLIRDDNNYSGIKYYKGMKDAVPGTKRPRSEGGNYARFKNKDAWWNEYMKTLRRSPGYPLQATNLLAFVARLKQNGYFTSSEAAYYARLKGIVQKMGGDTSAVRTQQDATIKAGAAKVQDKYQSADQRLVPDFLNYKTWKPVTWIALGLGAFILLERR